MRYYLGPWVLAKEPYQRWTAPAGCRAEFDFRPLPAQGAPDAVAGFGLFTTEGTLNSDYRLIGTGATLRDCLPAERDRSVFVSATGLAAAEGTNLAEWLFSALLLHADVYGDSAARPLMPERTGKRIKAFGIDLPFALGGAGLQIAVMQDNYRVIRAQGGETYRKYLDDLGLRYGIADPENVFIPGDLPKETRLPRQTTISDNFDRADASSLGSSSEGWSWTETTGTWAIVSNSAQQTAATSVARAESDLSSVDHYCESLLQFTEQFGVNFSGNSVRFSSSASTYYTGRITRTSATKLTKTVTGTVTDLGSTLSGQTWDTDYTVRCEVNGSTLSVDVDTVELDSITDTSITTGTRCGMAEQFTNPATDGGIWNNWTATDGLTVATGRGLLLSYARNTRVYQ